MTDVFISYSRKDKVITQNLVQALQGAGRDVWADWEDIPAASDWDAEIKQGIEEANSVVFILSPEWIKSNECRKEMVHAVKMGKRLVPILHIMPAEGQEVPPELAKLNWVYMRESDDFDKAFQTLLSAMDTDLDWIKTHTRIQVRALEWDKKNRSASFALRGEDLAEGEQFISGASGKSPEPTPLQGEYILSSRKDATRRQRQISAGVTVALIVSIVLGIATYFQRQEAVAQQATAQANLVVAQTARSDADHNAATAVANEKEAKRQAQIALARQLTAQAQSLYSARNSNQMIADLLAIQSLNIFPTGDATSFLINNNLSAPITSRMGHKGQIDSVVFSPDSRFVASGSYDGTIRVWEIATGMEVAHMNHEKEVFSIVYSPDGRFIASGGRDGTARVWDSMTGKEIAHVSHVRLVNSVDFSPDGNYVASGSYDRTVRVWEAMTGNEVARMSINQSVFYVAFSPDGGYLVANFDRGPIQIWETTTWSEIARITRFSGYHSLAFSPDEKYLALGGNRLIKFYELSTGKETAQVAIADFAWHIGFSSTEYITSSGENTVRVWEIPTGKEIAHMIHDDDISAFDLSSDGKYLVTGSRDDTARVWEVSTGKEIARTTYDAAITSVNINLDNSYVVSGSEDGVVRVWPINTDGEVANWIRDSHISSMALDPSDNFLATQSEDDTLTIWDYKAGKKITTASYDNSTGLLAYSPSGKFLALGKADASISIWEIKEKKEVAVINEEYDLSFSGFSPNEKYVLLVGDFAFQIWNVTGGKIASFVHDDFLNDIEFSANDRYIASGSEDGTAYIWETATGDQIYKFKDSEPVNSIVFSPDSRYAAFGNSDGWARMLDVTTGTIISRLPHDEGVLSADFSPNGKYIASRTEHFVQIWQVSTGNAIFQSTFDDRIISVRFSVNNKYIIVEHVDTQFRREFTVWDILSGVKLAGIVIVNSRASYYSIDDKYLVTSEGEKGIVRVWELATGIELARKIYDNIVTDVAISLDNKYIISLNSDGTLRVWVWQIDDLIVDSCARMPRNLTRAEWQQYIGNALPYPGTQEKAACPNLPIEPGPTVTP